MGTARALSFCLPSNDGPARKVAARPGRPRLEHKDGGAQKQAQAAEDRDREASCDVAVDRPERQPEGADGEHALGDRFGIALAPDFQDLRHQAVGRQASRDQTRRKREPVTHDATRSAAAWDARAPRSLSARIRPEQTMLTALNRIIGALPIMIFCQRGAV